MHLKNKTLNIILYYVFHSEEILIVLIFLMLELRNNLHPIQRIYN